MRMSQLFSQTIRETPSDAEIISHQLLLRAGFIRQLSQGIFSYLPLARRSLTKIEDIIRQEISAIGGQEITMPIVQPAEIWQESDHFHGLGKGIKSFIDNNNQAMVLSITHEAVLADLVRKEIRSYRQLPQLLYQIQTKWNDISHPRAGLIRAREYTMQDSYSLDSDWEGLEKQFNAHNQAYQRIFHSCGLPIISVKSDPGKMGGDIAREFIYLTPSGEESIIFCDHCGYSANGQIAQMKKTPITDESPLAIEKVATPNSKTIEALVGYLSIPTYKTAKAVFMIATILTESINVDRFVIAMVRGDMEVNEYKLMNALNASKIRPSTEDEIRTIGAIPGYASPVGLKDVFIVVDEIIPNSPNLVSGANIDGYHLRNVNYGRDYRADIIADITLVHEGDACIECTRPLRLLSGVEVGNTIKLGTHYSDSIRCNYLDKQGQSNPIVMGSYGIVIGRLLACIAAEHHDDYGLIWPITVSPYKIHLISLPWKNNIAGDSNPKMAEMIYQRLLEEKLECLYDDREESPGVKFNDADLIGNPIRLTISERSIKNGGIEYKCRNKQEKIIIPNENVIPFVLNEINILESELLI